MAAKPALTVTSKASGPFFAHDPVKTFGENVTRQIQAVTDAAARSVATQLRIGQGGRQPVSRIGGRVADRVIGRMHSLDGKAWRATGRVSLDASGLSPVDRLALFAAGARVEAKTHAFARADAAIARKLREDELLRGLK
jgi:hypothetical protein